MDGLNIASFTMKGSATVNPSTGGDANKVGKNDVYLPSPRGKINIEGELKPVGGTAARITPERYETTAQVLTGAITTGTPQNYTKFTVTPKVLEDGIAEIWKIRANGNLEKSKYMDVRYDKLAHYLSSPYASSHAVDGINYIKITGTIPADDLKSKYFEKMGKLAQTIQYAHKKVALKLPDSIPELTTMYNCFTKCEYLVSLEKIPSGVTSMAECFKGCTALTKAPVIPPSVNNMEHCFHDCKALTEAPDIPSGVTEIKYCFQGCKELTKAPVLPSGVTDIYGCFAGCEKLTKAPAIPSGVREIEHCFDGCKALTRGPDIPSSVTGMGQCFKYCAALTDGPDIPSNVEDMYQCFEGCTSLKGLKLRCAYSSSGTLFTHVFEDCSNLNNGGIKVPSEQLQTYKNNADHMGTTEGKFSEF